MRLVMVAVAACLILVTTEAVAQTPSGDLTIQPDLFPSRDNTAEIRARLFVEQVLDPTPRLLFIFSGSAEGLVAHRVTAGNSDDRSVADVAFQVVDANVTFKTRHIDLLAGSRFFFESRSEARLPVGLVRFRGYLSENASLEGVYVPFFRRGIFDQLDEPTSPFNIEPDFSSGLAACHPICFPAHQPDMTTRN